MEKVVKSFEGSSFSGTPVINSVRDLPGYEQSGDRAGLKNTNVAMVTIGTYKQLSDHPLGQMANENFSVPSNYRIPPARIYVVNHSLKRKWKRTIQAVSERQGAEDALMLSKDLRNMYNADMMYKQVEKGRDMNQYVNEVKPVVWKLALPGGTYALIPPSQPDAPDRLIMVEVPEGTWDMYLGNYNRMQGFPGQSPRRIMGPAGEMIDNPMERFSRKVQGDEETKLAIMWRQRHNPVFQVTDDGVVQSRNNPYGIIEFVRVSQTATVEPIDKEYLSALDLAESA
ncbi:MAG: hypothetical protein WA860_03435 [Acidimicrobiales bacterium]